MVREVGHAVKGRHGESASSPLKRGFQGLSIFKSLHNYHYGTFIIPAHSPTPNPERVQKHSQIATDESPSRVLGTLRLVWLLRHFLERNLLAICLWARFRVADAFSSKYLMRFACAHASADCSLTCFNLLSRPSLSTIPILIYRRGPQFWRIPFANLHGCLMARQNPHACARPTTRHALAPGAALTYNTANTGFTQARSLHGLCQQLLQLYTVSYS